MRISDWSSDVCSSDLSSKAFTFAQASLGLGKESSAPPTLAKNRPSDHRRADIFLKECMTWRRNGGMIDGGARKGCKCPFSGTRRRLPTRHSSLEANLRSFLQAKRANRRPDRKSVGTGKRVEV